MKKFPENFVWGCSTSAYQIEGACETNGKGPSIWDAFSLIPGRIKNNDSACVSADHYHHLEEDVQLMAAMGLKAYRFSIAWTRILPQGYGKVNLAGINFYNKLINLLLQKGIEPWPTLFHWDLPLTIQFEADGLLNPKISDYFLKYADTCFEHFGDRIKHWLTFNEPWVYAIFGHGFGVMAPGRHSRSEPYRVGYHFLQAHAKIVDRYREKYQSQQNGKIGMPLNCDWREPLTDKTEDKEAAQRALEFYLGWFADPLFLGDYPEVMKKRVADRLPLFTKEDKALIKGSVDFFALNHYTTHYAAYAEFRKGEDDVYNNGGFFEDQQVQLTSDPGWEKTTMGWNVVPEGLLKLITWIDRRYEHPDIFITENGCAQNDIPEDGMVKDPRRINYLRHYLTACHRAIQKGVNLKGYFVWSLLDNFEWALGYEKRFGLHYIDYKTGLRIAKESAKWYRDVILANGLK